MRPQERERARDWKCLIYTALQFGSMDRFCSLEGLSFPFFFFTLQFIPTIWESDVVPAEGISPQQWVLRDRWCIWLRASFSFYTSLIHRRDWLRKRLLLRHKSTGSHALAHTTTKQYHTGGSLGNDLISHWQKVQWYRGYRSPRDPPCGEICIINFQIPHNCGWNWLESEIL